MPVGGGGTLLSFGGAPEGGREGGHGGGNAWAACAAIAVRRATAELGSGTGLESSWRVTMKSRAARSTSSSTAGATAPKTSLVSQVSRLMLPCL
jgi:hypothetical protein